MSFPLNNFEAHIPSDLLRKGQNYWDSGAVDDLIEHDATFEATVYGSDDYGVKVVIRNGQVESWHCDCPYDWGPICKHVAAVLIEIREQMHSKEYNASILSGLEVEEKKEPIDAILDKLDKSELINLIQYFAKKNKEIKAHILTKYSSLSAETGKAHFQSLVQSIIESNINGRYGYLEYSDASRVGFQLNNLIEETKNNIPDGREIQLIYLCETIILEIARVYNNADDSNGDLGGAISEAIFTLDNLLDTKLLIETITYIHQFAKRQMSKEFFRGMDWGSDLKALSIKSATKEEEISAALVDLDEIIATQNESTWSSNFQAERAVKFKLEILEKWRGHKVANDFLKANLRFPSFRKKAIKEAIENKDFERAIELANQGIEVDTINKLPGLVKQWRTYLLEIAKASGNNHAITDLTEKMFLEHRDIAHYRHLKSSLSREEFAAKVEQFIQFFRSKERPNYWGTGFNNMVANIFVEEERWKDLMEEVKKNRSLNLLDRYYQELAPRFPDEYRSFYEDKTREMMENSTGRSIYETACEYLQKIIDLGGKEQAQQMVIDWRKKYPRRRAMLEVLDDFKI